MPEARINLAQATIHLALAPKSNAVITAIEAALPATCATGRGGSVPTALRDAHYPGAEKVPKASRYRYPARRSGRRCHAATHARGAARPRVLHTQPPTAMNGPWPNASKRCAKIIRGAEDDPTPSIGSSGTGRR